MRHAHISTTMGFYVEIGADEIAADLWASHGNRAQEGTVLGTTGQSAIESEAGQAQRKSLSCNE